MFHLENEVVLNRRAALALLPAAVLARTALAEESLEQAARKEAAVTWYIAQVDAEAAEELSKRFTAAYPGITVAAIRTTGQVAYQRLLLEMKNSAPQCDVLSTTDISHMPALKERNGLLNYQPPNASALLPEFQRLSDPGWYYATSATNHFLGFNTRKVAAADAPRKWTDLLDPKWKNQIALPHPGFSGCGGVWATGIRKVYGWEFFEKLAANNPRIGRSFGDPVTLLTAGECMVGPVPANAVFPSIEKGNPLAIVYPEDGCSLCVAPSGIPAAAPHPNAARLFLNWLLSAEYAQASIERGSEAIRDGLTLKPGRPQVEQLSILHLSVAEIRKGVPEVIEQWRETFGS
jgi:iron(III) transport system substrate-binding protein